ncbi:21409_t:CDS:2, partial [Gigaspora margarita]
HETTVKYLIKLNASLINEIDKNKETALYDAVWNDIALISCQPEAFIFLRDCIENNSKNTDLFNQINESHLNKPGNNDIDSLSFYQFFLKHIEKYEENLNDEERKYPEQYKKYNNAIKTDVQEAYSTIHDIIKPEMENIGDKINEKMKSLIDEAKQLIEGAEENKKDLEKKQKDLKNKLILKKLLGILKITSHAMAIEKGTNKVMSLIPEDKNYESKFEISYDIRSSLIQLDKISKDDQVKIVEQKLQKLNEICSKNPKLSDILSEIKKAAVNKNSEEILKLVQNKLKLKQEKLEEKLKKPKNNDLITNQETKEMLEILDILNNAVKQTEDDIKKLKSYEENIYSQIIPMIEKMQNDMNNLGNQIDKKSHVFLDLSKWQVRSSLNEVKIILRQISKGFPEIRDYLTSYMDKLNEGMTTIINIYDRIQSYYDQSRLANYIANISSPTNTTEIENENLKKEIEKLEREI